MLKVKFTPYRKNAGKIFYRQTKGHQLTSLDGRYRFYIDEETEEADFWVVQGKGTRKPTTCRVAPENTILLTTEPESVLVYPESYTRQFGLVHTTQLPKKLKNLPLSQLPKEEEIVEGKHFGPCVLPWFVGFKRNPDGKHEFTLDYDTLHEAPTPRKEKLISVITSDKAFTQGHLDRIRFVEKLKLYYGDSIDVFGRGVNGFEDKWDVLAKYKYHIVIENSSEPYYWTEKISDCFLAETYPFYFGCTNLEDYFPSESFARININDFASAVAIIDKAISENRYETSMKSLKLAKNMVLDEYNMFEYIARLCDRLNPEATKQNVTIGPCHSMKNAQNAWNYLIGRHLYERETKSIKGKAIEEMFDEIGDFVYTKRNKIKIINAPNGSIVVKQFKRANPWQRIAYTFFRKSKAERAFENAKQLIERGIDTPQPIAFENIKKCGLFLQGYYISAVDNNPPIQQLLKKEDGWDKELAKAFAQFVAELHEKGILHHDLNSTNVLYHRDETGKYRFSVIDINRMDFYDSIDEIGINQLLENLTRFTGNMELFEFVAREYASARNINVEEFVAKALLAKTKHDEAWRKRKAFTKKFKQNHTKAK